jgi:precorrin-6B methylase 2
MGYTREMLILYWLIAIGLGILFLGLMAFLVCTLFYIFPMYRGAVYVPSKPEAIDTMLKLAKLKPGMKVTDLGCGDGRVVLAFAEAGAIAHGYEVNPLLVWRAKRAINKAGLGNRAFVHLKSYWDVDLSAFDVVTVYGITYIMESLEEKLIDELRPGAKVLSNYFTFPNWKKSKTLEGIHLYRQV